MSRIKKLGVFIILLVGSGYAAVEWKRHADFEKTGEDLVRQLGAQIVTNLGQMNATCRSVARIESVALDTDGLLGMKGSAVLYITGRNDSVISISYRMETVGDKVWVQPRDQISAQLSVMQFGLRGCG